MALQSPRNGRRNLGDQLADLFRKDEKRFLLYLDSGYSDLVDFTHGDLKRRAVNVGICEQAAVSIAAGMAIDGLRPVVYGIASFLCFRALEQIRLDLVSQNVPVKLIGIGAGRYFQHLGISHTTDYDDRIVLSAIKMLCFDYGPVERFNGFEAWAWHKGPAYLRVT